MEDLDVDVPQGRLQAGVDAFGYRHLLIPVEQNARVDGLFDGRSIQLRRRPLVVGDVLVTFAALSCTRGELFAEFSTLAADVVAAISGSAATEPLDAVRTVLGDWRELLQAIGGGGLDRSAIVGLYGELLLLERLVYLDPRRRTEVWTGADRTRHDFQRANTVVESKTTAARTSSTFTVHGLDQLEAPPQTTLYLSWTRVEPAVERGESLRTLVERLRDVVSDAADFSRKLEAAGYRPTDDRDYSQPTFVALGQAFYEVDGTFPRLTAQSLVGGALPLGVTAIDYQVDLAGRSALDEDEAARVLQQLAGV